MSTDKMYQLLDKCHLSGCISDGMVLTICHRVDYLLRVNILNLPNGINGIKIEDEDLIQDICSFQVEIQFKSTVLTFTCENRVISVQKTLNEDRKVIYKARQC